MTDQHRFRYAPVRAALVIALEPLDVLVLAQLMVIHVVLVFREELAMAVGANVRVHVPVSGRLVSPVLVIVVRHEVAVFLLAPFGAHVFPRFSRVGRVRIRHCHLGLAFRYRGGI